MTDHTNNNKPAPEPCKWCGDKTMGYPQFLDRDGVLCSLSGEPGILSHAYEDSWWPCLKFGVEMHCSRVSVAGAAPTVDALVDEVQRRMDQVVEAAVEWHQAGREGREWFDASERLSAAIDSLLELRSKPAAPECFCGTELEAGLCPNGHDPITPSSAATAAPAPPVQPEGQQKPSQPARDAHEIALAIAEEIAPHMDFWFRLNGDWKEQIAAKVLQHFPAATAPVGLETPKNGDSQ